MRINDKIEEINVLVGELKQIKPKSFDEYKRDIKSKAACERYFEKIVEAVVDLAFIIIRERRYEIPDEDKKCFDILSNNKVIALELAARLKDAKGMRNILAHEYGKVDDELVYSSIAEEIIADSEEFIKQIESLL